DFAGFALGLDDLPAFLDAGAHRHGAGDVLSGPERRDALRGVVRDRRVDMDRIDVGVLKQFVEVGVALLDSPAISALVEVLLRPPADGVHLRVGMLLINGNELGAKTQADDGNADLLVTGHEMVPLEVTVTTLGLFAPAKALANCMQISREA